MSTQLASDTTAAQTATLQTQLVIDNVSRGAANGAVYERRSPTTGQVVTRAAAASAADAVAAADSAQAAFAKWSKSAPSERRRVLLKAADILEAKTPAIIEAMAREVGASALWAGFNVFLAAGLFREAASLATQIQGETIPTDKPDTLSMTVRQPVGVILSIVPWNGPVVLAARAIAYPIVCGNTVVFRASETSPKTHALLAESLYEAGLPAGVLNFVTNDPDDAPAVIDALIAHKGVRRINFTGSTRVGRIIAQKAAPYLKRCLLELGGKSPLVVLDDADVEEAVKAAIFGSFLYQGQICMSTERIVVDNAIGDEFVQKFAAGAKALKCGDPGAGAGNCVVGPMINASSGPRLNAMIDEALAKGAKLVAGGKADGAVMPATILDHVTPTCRSSTKRPLVRLPLSSGPRTPTMRCGWPTKRSTACRPASSVATRTAPSRLPCASIRLRHSNGATVQNEAQALWRHEEQRLRALRRRRRSTSSPS